MDFQLPFKCAYQISQGYNDNANNIYNGPLDGHHHGALDIVPLLDGNPFPAPIYPISNGSEISVQDTDPVKGKGVRERILLDAPTIEYFQTKGLIPTPVPAGQVVCLDVLYWHMLDVTDKDGILTEDTPIGHAGNTGSVYHFSAPVPDDQKGQPPYLGLHLHLETCFGSVQGMKFNVGMDPQGRTDPSLVLSSTQLTNNTMNQAIVVKSKTSPQVYICYKVPDMDWLQKTCNIQAIPFDPANIPDSDKL
jgi:hypothetical protein